MTDIWIVMGTTGEYSGRSEWLVEARSSEDAAKDRVKRLEELVVEFGLTDHVSYEGRKWAKDRMQTHPEGDPRFEVDYTGTSYFIAQCELKS